MTEQIKDMDLDLSDVDSMKVEKKEEKVLKEDDLLALLGESEDVTEEVNKGVVSVETKDVKKEKTTKDTKVSRKKQEGIPLENLLKGSYNATQYTVKDDIPLNKIKIHEKLKDIVDVNIPDHLTISLSKVNMITPIVVIKQEDDYFVVRGVRRFLISQQLGYSTITAVVIENEKAVEDIIYLRCILQGKGNLTDLTEYLLVKKFKEEVFDKEATIFTYSDLDATFSFGKKTTEKIIKLINFKDQVLLDQVESGTLIWKKALSYLETKAKEEREETIQELEELSEDTIKSIKDEVFKEIKDEKDVEFPEEDMDVSNDFIDTKPRKASDRQPIPKEIKIATLVKDNFTCQISGDGGQMYAPILLYHHIIPYSIGGKDTVANGLSVTENAHQIIHIIEKNKGRMHISKKAFDELSPRDKKFMINALKYGKIAYLARKAAGQSDEDIVKEVSQILREHTMPGTDAKLKLDAYKEYISKKQEEKEEE